ncbi:MAG TPA: class I SAM-dependent methyltransferase [Halanaerobiales bacterium]|nr:class I SAM-dependent methyltransferase [Halanaerobiales bacterium]
MENRAYTKSFAEIYDDIMGAVPYRFWYDYLQELLNYYQLTPSTVLDLACGTGSMSFLFSDNGYQVKGIDRSPDMLAIARNKAVRKDGGKPNFLEADIRDFLLEKKYDLAISLFDSLNYILEYRELKRVFENAYKSLNRQGLFIFDMNTIKRLMSIKPGSTIIKRDNYTCVWEDIIDKEKEHWQVKLNIYFQSKGEYFEEFHQERGYLVEDVVFALKEVGFNYIVVYNAYTFEKGSDNDNRLYYLAFKKKPLFDRNKIMKLVYCTKWKLKKLLTGSE